MNQSARHWTLLPINSRLTLSHFPQLLLAVHVVTRYSGSCHGEQPRFVHCQPAVTLVHLQFIPVGLQIKSIGLLIVAPPPELNAILEASQVLAVKQARYLLLEASPPRRCTGTCLPVLTQKTPLPLSAE